MVTFLLQRHQGNADLVTPMLDEVDLPPLIGEMLFEGVHRKKPTAGSLDGWEVGGCLRPSL